MEVVELEALFKSLVSQIAPLGTEIQRKWRMKTAQLAQCRQPRRAAQLSEEVGNELKLQNEQRH
jgi:hypothetical protein